MKRFSIFLGIFLLSAITIFAQVPEKFKYQAVIRDGSGNILVSQAVEVLVEIVATSPTGTVVFSETHNTTTNEYGVVNLEIGSVNDLSLVDWTDDVYFVRVSLDGVLMGASQILSVPYAITAKNIQGVVEVTGTTSDSYNSISIAFPSGFTKENTRVLSLEIGASISGSGTYWRSMGTTLTGAEGSVYTSVSSAIFIYYPNDDNYKNKPLRMVLMKVE